MSRFAHFALLAAVAFSFSACKNLGKKNETPDYAAQDGDYVTGTPLPDRQEGVSFLSSNVEKNRFQPIYFAFDSYAVGAGERGKIDEVASFMRSSSSTVIIAGFTDERGTPEYNRGLGELRAQAVRQALIGAGADPGLLQTVSFGAEMPADPGSGEAAWARNRRAEFGVTR
ncbi:MAG: OmpA family protein [Verrucomicrobiaceae bacterium]|nr:MAG: OmpA family protein [Verrucomicrobiaceae bacterium]